jgi:hypothetical protein
LILLSVCLVCSFFFSHVESISIPSSASGPYYQESNFNEPYFAKSTISISGASSMNGNIIFTITQLSGTMFNATSANNYLLSFPIILPNSMEADATYGCLPFTFTKNDAKQNYFGAIIIVSRGNGCSFDAKIQIAMAVGASGIIIYNNQPLLVTSIVSSQMETIPSMFISQSDGMLLTNFLQSNPTIPLTGTVVGTGPISSSDKDALLRIASTIHIPSYNFDPSDFFRWQTSLRTWDDLLANPQLDPCLYRIVGLWCERGRVVSIALNTLGVSGVMDSAWGALSQLKYIDVGQGKFFYFLRI